MLAPRRWPDSVSPWWPQLRGLRGAAQTAVLALALLVLVRWSAQLTLPLLCAALLFLLLSPAAEAIQRRGMPAFAAAALLVLAPTLAIGMLAFASAPAAREWWNQTLGEVSRLAVSGVADAVSASPTSAAAAWLLEMVDTARTETRAWVDRSALPVALQLASVLMLVLFLLLGQRALLDGLVRALPRPRARVALVGALREACDGVVAWTVTLTLINLGLAVATALALAAIGRPHAPAWAGVIFVLLFIPYLGPLLVALLLAGAGAGAGAGAAGHAPWFAPGLFLLFHAIEAHLISPVWVGRRLRLGRPAQLVAVLIGGWCWGVLGAVLAVPLLVVLRSAMRRLPVAPFSLALLRPEGNALAIADLAARVVRESRPGSGRVRRMPVDDQRLPPCDLPTLRKPIRPK